MVREILTLTDELAVPIDAHDTLWGETGIPFLVIMFPFFLTLSFPPGIFALAAKS